MSTLAIELHDAGVLLRDEAGAVHGTGSPGFALLDGDKLRTGTTAAQAARVHPRHVHHTYWQNLATSPLGRPFPREWSSADLAHAHLERLRRKGEGDPESVLVAASGGFSGEQLALLLSIARSAGLPVTAMADSAVAAAAAASLPPGHYLHLDLHLHRLVATELEVGDAIARGQVHVEDEAGLLELSEAWVRTIADAFVRQTRFDPLHSAASEQQLFDGLDGWLVGARHRDRLDFAMTGSDSEHRAEILRCDLIKAAEPLYGALFDKVNAAGSGGETPRLVLAQRTGALPGLEEMLEELTGRRPVVLPLDAAVRGLLNARGGFETSEPGVRFITRLTGASSPPLSEPSRATT